MLALQIISALLLLLNKYFVFKKKTIGWSLGILGTITITIYFYLQMVLEDRGNLWIMVVYDVALIFIMIYGYLVSSSVKKHNLNKVLKKWNLIFKIVIFTITTVVCIFFLIQAINENLVLIQFFSVLGGLVGTIFLALNKKTVNIIGWISYLFTHLLVTYLMIETGSPFIAICQIFSAAVAFAGMRNEFLNRHV
ncbi:nicotinamide mononucleotide transporter [Candidatus Nomurabacteria bacterium]|nr:nicotinamide mononucleotide transporter [Candidatus Nomurabacteria bacterium]